MGGLHEKLQDYEEAARYYYRTLRLFKFLGSPYQKKASECLQRMKDQLGEERFSQVIRELEAEIESGEDDGLPSS